MKHTFVRDIPLAQPDPDDEYWYDTRQNDWLALFKQHKEVAVTGLRLCSFQGCKNKARKGSVCRLHGAPMPKCSVEGCVRKVQSLKICRSHGAPSFKCIVRECNAVAKRDKLCKKHHPTLLRCATPDCDRQIPKAGETCARCKGYRKDAAEFRVQDFLKQHFGDKVHCTPNVLFETQTFIPDMVVEFTWGYVIIEVDEDHHSWYDIKMEALRMRMILDTLSNRGYFIRLNPDAYIVHGQVVPVSFEERMEELLRKIRHMDRLHAGSGYPMIQECTFLYYPEKRKDDIQFELFSL